MTIKKKTWILTGLLVFLLLLLSGIQFRALRQVDSVMETYRSKAVYRIALLEEIKSQFGYGGFIHNFKNHVLRGQAKYATKFQKNDAAMKKALKQLKALATGPKDREAIAQVEAVAAQYAQAINVSVRMWGEGKSQAEIDKTVKINDGPAFAAFEAIEKETQALEAKSSEEMNRTITRLHILIACVLAVMVFCFAGYIFLLFGTIRRIEVLRRFAGKLGKGDFTATSEIQGKDELGAIARAFDEMVAHLHKMLTSIQTDAMRLDDASGSLSQTSGVMLTSAEDVMGRSSTVAAAAEEMSTNMNSVAAAAEQAANNVGVVANAAEEMLTSIEAVTKDTGEANQITQSAVEESRSASARVHELGQAAEAIGKVTEAISEISEQTNLLALNATIEAARAGEAGKGFAVVAGEIKNLASQTSDATQEIKASVDGIQNSTQATVAQIEQISSIIDKVNLIVSQISDAVERQSGTTTEIARNVMEAAHGLDDVTQNVSESSRVAGTVATDIAGVHTTAGQLNGNSGEVDENANHLRALSQELKEMVGRFTL